MVNKKELRTAYLANNESEKAVRNIMVDIEVAGNVPIIGGTVIDNITGLNGVDYGLMEDLETNTPAETEVYNVLFDKTEGKDKRYKFLGKAKSLISGLFLDFYYDADFKDILAIPELAGLGYGVNSNFYSNDKRTIKAYSIGYGEPMGDRPGIDIVLPNNSNDIDGISEPNRFTKTRTILASLFGLEKNSMFAGNYTERNLLSNFSKRGAPLQMVVLEPNVTLFGKEEKVNTYNLLQQYHNELKIDYVGKQPIEKIVVIINF